MKVFITGGTGNIGQYVTLAALERGHEAVVLSREPEKYPLGAIGGFAEKAKLVKGKITDYALLADYVKGCDAVIHIALGWGDEPASMLANDTAATINLLEISEKAGVQKFIYTSSTAAMGKMRNGMDETVVNLPIDLYGSTKSAAEAYVLGFTKYYGSEKKVLMKRNIIRPGYTYSNPPFAGGSTEPDSRFRDIADAVINNKSVNLTKRDGTQFISAGEIALEYYPESKSEIMLNDLGWGEEPLLFCVEKIKKDFGLSFDSQKDLRAHIKWTIENALSRRAAAS